MDIKIFVAAHKPVWVPDIQPLCTVVAGAALGNTLTPNGADTLSNNIQTANPKTVLSDDSGDNISAQNGQYCELTVQYWAWKNARTDAVGFFQYRRYLVDFATKRPYVLRLKKEDAARLVAKTDYLKLMQECDILTLRAENMHTSVRNHFASAHSADDLQKIEGIIAASYPEYAASCKEYLDGTMNYFGNIFVMRWQIFDRYCTWLFDILNQFDQISAQKAPRTNGYLAERLLGIFLTHCQKNGKIVIKHLPKVEVGEFFPSPLKRLVINALLPPGTKRRAMAKKIIGG